MVFVITLCLPLHNMRVKAEPIEEQAIYVSSVDGKPELCPDNQDEFQYYYGKACGLFAMVFTDEKIVAFDADAHVIPVDYTVVSGTIYVNDIPITSEISVQLVTQEFSFLVVSYHAENAIKRGIIDEWPLMDYNFEIWEHEYILEMFDHEYFDEETGSYVSEVKAAEAEVLRANLEAEYVRADNFLKKMLRIEIVLENSEQKQAVITFNGLYEIDQLNYDLQFEDPIDKGIEADTLYLNSSSKKGSECEYNGVPIGVSEARTYTLHRDDFKGPTDNVGKINIQSYIQIKGERYHYHEDEVYNVDANPDGYGFYTFNDCDVYDYLDQATLTTLEGYIDEIAILDKEEATLVEKYRDPITYTYDDPVIEQRVKALQIQLYEKYEAYEKLFEEMVELRYIYVFTNEEGRINELEMTSYEHGHNHILVFEEDAVVEVPKNVKIIAGRNQRWEAHKAMKLTFTIDADLEDFKDIYVDNKRVDPKYYTVKAGSIMISFTDAYLNTLANGRYEIIINLVNGKKATTLFTILNNDTETPSEHPDEKPIEKPEEKPTAPQKPTVVVVTPKTGIKTATPLYTTILFMSGFTILKFKKKYE